MKPQKKQKVLSFFLFLLTLCTVIGCVIHWLLSQLNNEMLYWIVMSGYTLGCAVGIFVCTAMAISNNKIDE